MESSGNAAETAISALKARNLPIKRDEIEAAFSRGTTESYSHDQWVAEHLTGETLLSQEELQLYSKLEASGTLQTLLQNVSVDAVPVFQDRHIQDAIGSLRDSSVAIQKQTETLTLLSDALDKNLRVECERGQRRSRNTVSVRKTHESARQAIDVASGHLSHELGTKLANEVDTAAAEGKKMLASVTARLKEDDRTLAALEESLAVTRSAEGSIAAEQVDELCSALAEFLGEEIRGRLDRLYLEATQDSNSDAGHTVTDMETIVAALEEELDSLYPEIDVLASMATKQQFGEPIIQRLQQQDSRMRLVSHQRLERGLEAVMQMTATIADMTERLEVRESSYKTTQALLASYQSEIEVPKPKNKRSRRETMLRRSAGPSSLLLSSPMKGSSHGEDMPALESLLRRLGIPSEAAVQSQTQQAVLSDQKAHMLDGQHHFAVAADAPLAAELHATDCASQLLHSALHADSQFQASLSSRDQASRLAGLEKELGTLRRGMEGLKLDALYQDDRQHGRFIERWT
ncbi:hypothetical protein ASPZODRAFT_11330 [Penicilliopsis zonata CBS 506.65]|uniref:HAUS augmin-like complex subunit 3 N-terminal domain-containing protein n=1 Tax=Penicilliopsis zonata CBS 506.65 TaxID=1073090 RepID=A0A1L9STD6_9EURO|nr:hypothetical protein ASPZODRAFT_11330 [Penicilliopsis zonata CBS 506.65]OJJ50459.1 hypothetical protein ASPZODRAFT_11330 [Penicilliopsis zonata CBS 506.65]